MLSDDQKSLKMNFASLSFLDDKILTEKHQYHAFHAKRDPALGLGFIASGFTGIVISGLLGMAFGSWLALGGVSLSIALAIYGHSLVYNTSDHKKMAEHTRSLADLDTDICDKAFHILENCTSARAWRDQAVARPRTLRGFDYEVMLELFTAQEAEKRAEFHRNRCQQLHGITA